MNILMVKNPMGGKKRAQPQTKVWLIEMLSAYCEGDKKYGEPNTWDVTLVTDMSNLFYDMKTFNAPIDQWDTSQVTNMSCMFAGAKSFNQPITMDTSKVTNMNAMFSNAWAMKHPVPSC